MDGTDLSDQIRDAWGDLAPSTAFRIVGLRPDAGAIEHRPDAPLEVGSCFKAFVAAACCRAVARGALRWDEPLLLAPDRRVPSSDALDKLPDGASVTLRSAAEAMIGVSDNTATDLVLGRIGPVAVRALVAEAGLGATRLPDSVRSVYDAITADPLRRVEACVSTMRDLTRFYAWASTGGLTADPATLDAFWSIMRREDEAQGTAWPAAVVCYRKSGHLEPPPLLAVALAGAFVAHGRTVRFAFACNVAQDDEAAAARTIERFTDGVSRGMRGIATALAAPSPERPVVSPPAR